MNAVKAIRWKHRDAISISNGIVELIALSGGGHLAAFHLLVRGAPPLLNTLWEAPWNTQEPVQTSFKESPPFYGDEEGRRFLASYTGHALCLDHFGAPSAEMRAAGMGLHGEAAVTRWNWGKSGRAESASYRTSVRLPLSGLAFEREIWLGDGEAVAYVRETVTNMNNAMHTFDWVQHVTFGPPLIKEGESTLIASVDCGMTSPLGYEGCSMLDFGRMFDWPYAPGADGKTPLDLRRPFALHRKGFIAGVKMDVRREVQFLIAINWHLRLGIVYLFRRRDFPWMTLWEENCARRDPPWNGSTQARGMEFGTSLLPIARGETVSRRPLFDTPQRCLPPKGEKKQARYLISLFEVPATVSSISRADAAEDAIVLHDHRGVSVMSISAATCGAHLLHD